MGVLPGLAGCQPGPGFRERAGWQRSSSVLCTCTYQRTCVHACSNLHQTNTYSTPTLHIHIPTHTSTTHTHTPTTLLPPHTHTHTPTHSNLDISRHSNKCPVLNPVCSCKPALCSLSHYLQWGPALDQAILESVLFLLSHIVSQRSRGSSF